MSKKIVIELTEDEAKIIANMALANAEEKEAIEKTVFNQVFDQLMIGTERSVIEWHGIDENPKNGDVIFIKYESGVYSLDIYHSDELDDWKMDSGQKAIAWAYLPE